MALSAQLSIADHIVFYFILLLTIGAIAVSYARRKKNETSGDEDLKFLDYLLMGRRLSLPLFVATLVSSWYGGIFGVTEIAFESGVYNFLTQGVFWYITYILFALLLVDKIRSFGAITLPELVGKMYGPRAEKIAAIFNFFNILPVAYALSAGLFVQTLTGWDLTFSVVLATGFVCLYTMCGGFRADVFTDVVQFAVMCTAVLMVTAFAVATYGGLGFLQSHLPPAHFDPMGGHGLSHTLVWGFIALATLVDPGFYQRCFAATNSKTAKLGILISTLIWCIFDLCTTAGGMYARAVLPDAAANQAYLLFGLQLLPSGLRGFFLAGILATILSTLDSFLFIASNTLCYDLLPKRFGKKMLANNLCTVLAFVVTVALVPFFHGSVKDVWKTLGSYSAGCLLLPMLCGYIRPHWIGEKGFIFSTLMGAAAITWWRFTEHQGFWQNVDDLYIGLSATLAGMVLSRSIRG